MQAVTTSETTTELNEAGPRVEQLLNELAELGDPHVREKAEEAVGLLLELYGGALEQIAEILTAEGRSDLLERLARDELVGGLLILHNLHPKDTTRRVEEALDSVRPYLGSHAGGVDLLDVDDEGVVHLELQGSCDGCPSSAVTVKYAIEQAIEEAAPEVTGVAVKGESEEQSGQGSKEPNVIPVDSLFRRQAEEQAAEIRGQPQWSTLPEANDLQEGELRAVDINGTGVLVCNSGGTLYAYRNVCPSCAAGVADGELSGELLGCPSCGHQYNLRLAGRSPDSRDVHLDPVPLLTRDGEVRVALEGAAT